MSISIFTLCMLLTSFVHAENKAKEYFKMPPEIKNVRLGMSGRELVNTRSQLQLFLGVDDEDQDPRKIDFFTRKEELLFEELSSSSSFGLASYYIAGGSLAAISLGPGGQWSSADVFQRRPKVIKESISRWGPPALRIVEADRRLFEANPMKGEPAYFPLLIWRKEEVVISLSVPTNDHKSAAKLVYALEIRLSRDEKKSRGLTAPEAEISAEEREKIFISLGVVQSKSEK